MSHFLTFVTNENGVVIDPAMPDELDALMKPVFGFNDVNVYSHGWWTDATAALNTYNQFSVGYAAAVRAAAAGLGPLPQTLLNIGIHWPSMLSEDRGLLNVLEATSFFTMEKRADDVGETGVYALLRKLVEQRQGQALTVNVFGHSFGCKVVCAALNRLATTCGAQAKAGLLQQVSFNVVLLQAAFDADDFEPGQLYAAILPGIPRLRVLVTRSDLDKALTQAFPFAHGLEFFNKKVSKTAMGAAGPTGQTVQAFGGAQTLSLNLKQYPASGPAFTQRLVVADLTPLHKSNAAYNGGPSGHHSDIYHDEIYSLIGRFLH